MTDPTKPQDVKSDALTAASEAYRAHLDTTKQSGVYSHTKGAAGKRNVLVVAVAFDGFMDLGATFAKVLELFAADVDRAASAKSKSGDPGQQDGRS